MKSVSFDEIKRRLFATKIFSIIRICLLLLICSVMRAFASIGYSQMTTLSLDLKNVSVEEVLNEIGSEKIRFILCGVLKLIRLIYVKTICLLTCK